MVKSEVGGWMREYCDDYHIAEGLKFNSANLRNAMSDKCGWRAYHELDEPMFAGKLGIWTWLIHNYARPLTGNTHSRNRAYIHTIPNQVP